MLKVRGIEIDFDITAPSDMAKYTVAGKRMVEEAEGIKHPSLSPDDPGFVDAYIEMLNAQISLYEHFLDGAFGDGIGKQLLGDKPSLNGIADIDDELGAALEAQGTQYGVRVEKYKPNRATRQQPNIATMQQLGWKAQ